MTVYDRWHLSHPPEGAEKCKTHKMVPSAQHGKGDRWQVRWRDDNGTQHKQNFRLKEGKDPDQHADAYDAQLQASIDADTYTDPKTGETTLEEYARGWLKNRTHGDSTWIKVEYLLRLHVFSDPANRGRTMRDEPALGHYKLRELARRPSLTQTWIGGMRLSDDTKLKVMGWVSGIFRAAVHDGLIHRNPLESPSITRPRGAQHEAVPLSLGQLDALSAALRHSPGCLRDCNGCGPSRYEILPYLGAATGQRQGELFAIDTEKDLDFLRRVIHVRRQVKIIRGKQFFAPLKNRKIHDVPMTDAASVMLAEYIRQWPPEAVTLPWSDKGAAMNGKPVTHVLLLSRGAGLPMHRKPVNDRWRAALKRAGITADRHHMMHVLRHTAASAWLSAGVSVRAVAEFLGDTEAVVQKTYSHLMPDDRDRARKAMERFFARPEAEPENSPGADIVP